MQDRHRRIVEIFLLRTAGPYIGVKKPERLGPSRCFPLCADKGTSVRDLDNLFAGRAG